MLKYISEGVASKRGDTMALLHIFATNMKRYRLERNLSQEKLAELSGLHRTYISSIERELRNISIDNVENIASALVVEPYRLFIDNEKAGEK